MLPGMLQIVVKYLIFFINNNNPLLNLTIFTNPFLSYNPKKFGFSIPDFIFNAHAVYDGGNNIQYQRGYATPIKRPT